MENYKYVITLYMSKTKETIDVLKIMNFSIDIAKIYNVIYEEFSFSYMIGEKENTKTLKHTQKNIEKLSLIKNQNVTGLTYSQYKKQKHHADPKFRMRFFISNIDNYPNQFSIIIDEDQLEKGLSSDDIRILVDYLDALSFKVEYGAAFVIETKKAPNYFIMGSVSRYLTAEEKDMASALALNIRQYKSKIWDIFWFNIIKKVLISEEILNNIKEVLPNECILEDGDKYIISLPLQSDEYVSDKDKLDMYREKLRHIFRENGLTMYTGQRFPHFV